MPHYFVILFKINIVLLLFAAAYYLILRRLTFYAINRLFLLFGILFSTVYPFINLTRLFKNHQAIAGLVPRLNNNITQQTTISIYWKLLAVLFFSGVVIMAMRLIIQFLSLRRIHQNSKPGNIENYTVRILADQVSPFSFWQTIYINPLLHQKQDLNNILEHEKVHVEEWHTLDIILSEVSVVLYWFNPGVWLMKRAVKENIEFITDAKILKKGIDKKAYQYSLLDVGNLKPSLAILNNFNISDLKKRIKMMNAKRSSPLNLSRYVFVLPVLLMVTLAFTIGKNDVQNNIKQQEQLKYPLINLETVNIVKKEIKDKSTAIKHASLIGFFRVTPVNEAGITAPNYASNAQNLELSGGFKPRLFASDELSERIPADGSVPAVRFENGKELMVIQRAAINLSPGVLFSAPDTSNDRSKTRIITVINSGNENKSSAEQSKDRKKVFVTARVFDPADTTKEKTDIFLNGEKISLNDLSNRIPADQIKHIFIKRSGLEPNNIKKTAIPGQGTINKIDFKSLDKAGAGIYIVTKE